MKWTKYFHYPPSTRSTTDGLRTYDVGNEKLPSVTTILGATKSQDAKDSISNWQAKVGMDEAIRIRDTAASRGTNMHKHLEHFFAFVVILSHFMPLPPHSFDVINIG